MGTTAVSDLGTLYAEGALVWVRRRNGSWWPGRILGADEATPPTLESAKTGTPVKLLGRDDASVEWFNLEKSIRVKAFRCGEFDACIERVEASEEIPVKRRERYARREDAILHALELEKKQYKTGVITSNKISSVKKGELNGSSNSHSKKRDTAGCNQLAIQKSQMLSTRAVVSVDVDNTGREKDVPETTPRTRGLQDFGLRIAPPKKKHSEFVAWDRLQKSVDNNGDVVSCSGQNSGGALHAARRKDSFSHKRKSCTLDGSPAKRRDRRRPLHRVLESSAKLQSFHSFQPDLDVGILPIQGEDPMGAICRAKRSRCIYLPTDSNDSSDPTGYSFKHMPTVQTTIGSSERYFGSLAVENTTVVSEAMDSDSPEREYSGNNLEEEDNLLIGSDNTGTQGRYNDTLELQIHHQASNEVGVSKWHMKGKRNIRNIAKHTTNTLDGAISNNADKCYTSVEGTSYENKGIGFGTGIDHSSPAELGHDVYPKTEFNGCDGGNFLENDATHTQPIQLGNKINSDDDSHAMLQVDWEADRLYHVDRRTYGKEPDSSSPEIESMLVDVDLEVRASYQGEHVPLVSLMSRLNGKAIIGHPVQVEILEDGFYDRVVVSRNEHSLDEGTAPSPVWKTARRTVIQRVPRSNPALSALEGEGEGEGEELEPLQNPSLEGKLPLKKVYTSHFSHQARLAKKSISHARRSASGKFQRKLVRSVGLSGQKIRTLSSLSVGQKCSSENGDGDSKLIGGGGGGGGGDGMDGLIKSEGAGPLVTCVPVKVVFSRILEAAGRPGHHGCESNRVTVLRLPGSGLSGRIPTGTIGNLTALRTLSLRLNALSGPLPQDIDGATELRNLYLQGNRFSGSIPPTFFKLERLVRVSLASNSFSGEISPAFNNLTRIATLSLENNAFTGQIPDINPPKLEQFNVSNNQLNGSVPSHLRRFIPNSFLGMQLCGGSLGLCPGEIAPTPGPAGGGNENNTGGKKKKLSGGAIAGIAIGSVLLLLIILILLIFLCRKRSKSPTPAAAVAKPPEAEVASRDKAVADGGNGNGNGIGGAVPPAAAAASAAAVGAKGDAAKKLVFFGGGPRPFDLEDLLRASAEVLGKGTFGTAYKAVLEMGTVVAVKRLKDVNLQEREFRERIEAVGAMVDPNLVPLRAYYFSKDEKLLVYDYMPMGSLSALLHGNRGAGRTPLDWETRSSIALAAAKGLRYIHSTGPSASHGNIKSSNILLAKSYEARVSDHGLAYLAGPSSTPTRIAGYRAPEVTDIRKVSQKADVYSFGVLLLELLTGKAPQQALLNEEGVDLPRWVQSVVREEWTSEVFDLELLRYENAEEQMVQLLQLAVDCSAQYPDRRPSMSEVVHRIEEIQRSGERVVEQDPRQTHGIEEAEDQSSRKTDSSEGSKPPGADP